MSSELLRCCGWRSLHHPLQSAAQTSEVEDLCHILGVDGNVSRKKPIPEKAVEGKTNLRCSSRIKILKSNMQACVG
jgi:hypothetical protein